MSALLPSLAALTAGAGFALTVAVAPSAVAVPECTNTGPNTTLCERNGSASLNTAPEVIDEYPFGWQDWGDNSIGITLIDIF